MTQRTLKLELKIIEQSFPRGASPVETLSVNSEEVTFRFIDPSNTHRIIVQCNLPVGNQITL